MPGLGKPTVGSQYTTNGMIVSTNGPTIDADISGFSWGVNINGATAAASIGGDTTGQQLGNVQFVLGASEMVAGEVLPFAITGDPSVEVLFRAINPLPSTIVVDDYASGKSPADYVLATPSQKVATDGSGRVTVDSKTGYALTSAYDPAKTAAQAGDAMTLTSGERTSVAAAVWNALTSGMATVGSIGKKLADWVVGTIDTYTGNTKQTGDAYARMGAPAGASIAADVAAVKSDTGSIKTQTDKIGTSGGDSANTVTMQTRVDVAVSTRLAGSSYTAPDNTTVGTINTKLGTPASSVSADIAAVKTDSASLLAKLGAFTGSGINTVLGFLKALAGKTASAPSDMGGTFDPASDSLEAIADANEAFTTTGVILTSDAFDNIASPDPTSAPTTTTEKLALLLQTPLVIERAPTSGNGVISFVGSGGTTLFTRQVINSGGNQTAGAATWS
jgi:hypothetical protein